MVGRSASQAGDDPNGEGFDIIPGDGNLVSVFIGGGLVDAVFDPQDTRSIGNSAKRKRRDSFIIHIIPY